MELLCNIKPKNDWKKQRNIYSIEFQPFSKKEKQSFQRLFVGIMATPSTPGLTQWNFGHLWREHHGGGTAPRPLGLQK